MSSNRADEIKLDIDDLNSLLALANRQKSKDVISLEIRRLETQLSDIRNQEMEVASATPRPVSSTQPYNVKLTNYAWDQSDNFIKLYITLHQIQNLPEESIVCKFSERAFDLQVLGLDNKNYHLLINNLSEDINTSKSYFKQKTDMLIVYLAKEKSGKNWSCITGVEKQIKNAKDALPDNMEDSTDPGASLMNLMKKMYDSGDDNLKQTIAKAWTESVGKRAAGLNTPPL